MSSTRTNDIFPPGHDRLPPSSSVFLALASLSPPSPILSSSEICSVWSLSDIPILIFDDSDTFDVATRNRVSPRLIPSPGSESTDSICTFGTFGPTRDTVYPLDNQNAENSLRQGGNVDTECCRTVESISPLTSARMNRKHRIHEDTRPAKSNPYEDECSRRISRCHGTPAQIGPQTPTQTLCGILRSPTEATAYSIPGSSCAEHIYYGGCHISTLVRKEESPQHRTVPFPEKKGAPSNNLKLPLKPAYANIKQSPWPISPRANDTSLSPSHYRQDQEFIWLDGLSVDLLIDQEGFRSVHPSFKYSGISHNRMCPKDRDSLVVEFRPITRQVYHFHYAPFDGSPLLRRVTVNGEQKRDFVSRQARLTLKSNGVYSIHGVEISSLPTSVLDFDGSNHEELESIKLRWQFDYVVDDRTEPSGRIIDGEKTLTPLTFFCSPWLLHPSQGKRINVMHIVKKSVTPKLVAEKLQPPAFAEPVAPSHGRTLRYAPAWGLHRRAQSNGSHGQLSKAPATQQNGTSNAAVSKQSLGPANASNRGRRRASSAEHYSTPSTPALSIKLAPKTDLTVYSNHIFPPSRLAELILPEHKLSASPHLIEMPVRESSGFVPLTPRPRRS